MIQKDELIVTIHATPTETGKYMWTVEQQINDAGFPDWRLVAHNFTDSPFEAYKAAIFEVNKIKEVKFNEAD